MNHIIASQHHYHLQFVGRERELNQIADLLENLDCWLLTLVGYGGMGKTHLAIHAAAAQFEQFANGVYFVPLDALTAGEFMAPALANALKLPLSAGQSPLAQAMHYLRDKQALLVLDSFEHLIESAPLASEILQACAQVKVLVTSRERLNVLEEWVLPVTGLPIPPEAFASEGEPSSAQALFTQRDRRVRSNFAVTRENYAIVRRVCQLVDGMPLGIDLAAACMKLLPPHAIAREIEQSPAIPGRSPRNLPARQRSLRDLFEYGWNRLSVEQQRVLAQLAIFRGGFRRETAAAVADPYRVLLGRLGAEVRAAPGPAPAPPLYASQDSPTQVLASYYNAIDRQEYGRAYSYWETPPSPYDQFAQGYADTASVQLIVQLPAFIDAGAGNLHAAIPTVLVATKRDGSQQFFVGCYTTHKVNIQPDVWHLARDDRSGGSHCCHPIRADPSVCNVSR